MNFVRSKQNPHLSLKWGEVFRSVLRADFNKMGHASIWCHKKLISKNSAIIIAKQ